MCTGVVIRPNVVLTAAHCEDRFGAPELVAFIGEDHSADSNCHIAEVETSMFEPSSTQDLPLGVHGPDILLLKIKSPLCNVVPAKLHASEVKPGQTFYQAGHGAGSGDWGETHQLELILTRSQEALPLVTPQNSFQRRLAESADKYYEFALPIIPQSSVCTGDSGGPSYFIKNGEMHVFAVIGAILPRIGEGSQCDDAFVHLLTPIKPYLGWIEETASQWALP